MAVLKDLFATNNRLPGFEKALFKLDLPLRYPGGNFLSGYQWVDGIGPKAERPIRRDLTWFAIESNWVEINEFVGYCKRNNIKNSTAYTLPVSNFNTTGSIKHIELHTKIDAVNTETNSPVEPVEKILTSADGDSIFCTLQAASWNILLVPIQ